MGDVGITIDSPRDGLTAGDARPRGPSSEPLINWLHRHALVAAWVLFTLGLVEYSLLPLTIRPEWWPASQAALVARLIESPLRFGDVLANIAIYVPFGLLAYLAARRAGWALWTSLVAAVGGGAVLSLACEVTQTVLPNRFPSLVDCVCNSLGAALGGVIGAGVHPCLRWAKQRLRVALRWHPWSALAKLAACAVLLWHIRPFDVVLSRSVIVSSVKNADFRPTAEWSTLRQAVQRATRGLRPLRPVERTRARWDYVAELAGEAAAYALLAALCARGVQGRYGAGRRAAVGYGGFVVVSLSMIVLVVRSVMISRGVDTAHVLCGVTGALVAAVGARTYLQACPASRHLALTEPDRLAVPGRWFALAAMAATLLIAVRGLAPFYFVTTRPGPFDGGALVNWIPLRGYLGSRPNIVVLDLSTRMADYTLLAAGVCGAWAARSGRAWRVDTLCVIATCGLLAGGIETLHLFVAGRRFDLTGVMAAVAGAGVGAVGLRWARDYLRSVRIRQADDWLTSHLIEGKGFDKRAAVRPPTSRTETFPTPPARSGPRAEA